MTRLITRIAGVRAVIEMYPLGFGAHMWAGELRTDQDRPYPVPLGFPYGQRHSAVVRLGRPDTDGLAGVIAGLGEVATRTWRAPQRRFR